jgi:NAD+ synthase (glutamine-hydrolysing)
VAGAQLDLIVGDLVGNTVKIENAMGWAADHGADVLLVPELAITGYPPEDLVLRSGFVGQNLEALERLASKSSDTAVVVGFVDRLENEQVDDDSVPRRVVNAAAVLHGGRVVSVYHKTLLPNYGVFDEARYFAEGRTPPVVQIIGGVACGVSICEDIWDAQGRPTVQAAGGAEVLLNINGSPYHVGKSSERQALLEARATATAAHVVYVNCVGGQDELVFDGTSMVIGPDGALLHRSPQFAEDLFVVDLVVEDPAIRAITIPSIPVSPVRDHTVPANGSVAPIADPVGEIYLALTTALRDYVIKNGFSEVVIALSGGIDSALTAAIAADALGPGAVHGITMPTRYSSAGSVDDSIDLGERLGIRVDTIPVDPLFEGFLEALEPLFGGAPQNVA